MRRGLGSGVLGGSSFVQCLCGGVRLGSFVQISERVAWSRGRERWATA